MKFSAWCVKLWRPIQTEKIRAKISSFSDTYTIIRRWWLIKNVGQDKKSGEFSLSPLLSLWCRFISMFLFLYFHQWDVSITGFVIEKLDSVLFYHDIIFCLESDSIVVSFSSSTGFLRVDIRQFWFQHITYYFLSSCFHGVLLFLSNNLRAKTCEYAILVR